MGNIGIFIGGIVIGEKVIKLNFFVDVVEAPVVFLVVNLVDVVIEMPHSTK